jgi:hypothetical protein
MSSGVTGTVKFQLRAITVSLWICLGFAWSLVVLKLGCSLGRFTAVLLVTLN